MFKGLLKAAAEKVSGLFRGGKPASNGKYYGYRPVQGFYCIFSRRRQMRKRLVDSMPHLRSGRQWKKFRKAVKRETGLDFLKIPSFYVAR